MRRAGLAILTLGAIAATLTACTVSAAGGFIGGAGAAALAAALLFGGASQTGCGKGDKTKDEPRCLSVEVPDARRRAPAAPIDASFELTSCLSVTKTIIDAGVPDAPAPPDARPKPDARVKPKVHPCLSKPEPPMPVCLSLSDPFDSMNVPDPGRSLPPETDRETSVDRFSDRLPPDVIARLRKDS